MDTELKWLKDLQVFINSKLEPVIQDPIERHKYLGQEAMDIWVIAFTHETFSPTENYEELEYMGDAVLRYIFPKLLRTKYKNFTKGDYTNLNNTYMSKIPQAELSRKLGLGDYVRTEGLSGAELVNLQGDLFESFFGALEEITNTIIYEGLGVLVCYNMLVHIFSSVDIDLEKRRGPPKTQVIQIFTRFGLPTPIGLLEDNTFNVYLPTENIDFLKVYGLQFNEKVVDIRELDKEGNVRKISKGIIIGVGKGATKAEAEPNAYEDALKYLARKGVTPAWADQAKQVRDFSEPDVAPYAKLAEQRFLKEGFKSMFFAMPTKTITKTGAVVQLVGVRADGSRKILASTYSTDQEGRHRTAKGFIVKNYAEGR